MRPVIGITSDYNAGDREDWGGKEATYFLRGRYVSAVRDLGGVPLILPIVSGADLVEELLGRIDGLILTGSGPDLDPALYREPRRHRFRIMSQERAEFELLLARRAAERDLPTLGICGGMQLMNVAAGGSLIQDIASDIHGALQHQQDAPATEPSHEISVAPGSRLARILQLSTSGVSLKVNSSHHQGVKTPGKELRPTAHAPDGVVEALEHPGRQFWLGVQWHPEFMYARDEASRRLFEALLDAARCKQA